MINWRKPKKSATRITETSGTQCVISNNFEIASEFISQFLNTTSRLRMQINNTYLDQKTH